MLDQPWLQDVVKVLRCQRMRQRWYALDKQAICLSADQGTNLKHHI
jgi:hypothetical protein